MKKTIKLIGLILCMAMIYFFSSQKAIDSDISSNIVLEILHYFYTLFVDISLEDFILKYGTIVRKLAHFSEFFLLGIFAYLNVIEYYKDHYIFLSCLLCLFYAVFDEIHQMFVVGRNCSVYDILIDFSGSLLAILLCHLIIERCLKKSD